MNYMHFTFYTHFDKSDDDGVEITRNFIQSTAHFEWKMCGRLLLKPKQTLIAMSGRKFEEHNSICDVFL